MPIKKRHEIIAGVTALSGGAQSPAIDMNPYTRGIVYAGFAPTGTTIVVEAEYAPGFWAKYQEITVPTSAATVEGFPITNPIPSSIRINNTGAGPVSTWVEGVREIA